jgi:hypothetical protein
MGMIGYKQVEANEYPTDDLFYDAGRKRYFVEPGFMYLFSKTMYMTGKFRYSRVEDYTDAFAETDITYSVLNIDLALVASF